MNHFQGECPGPALRSWRAGAVQLTAKICRLVGRLLPRQQTNPMRQKVSGGFLRWRVGLLCGSMRNFLAGVIPWPNFPVLAVLLALCRVVVF